MDADATTTDLRLLLVDLQSPVNVGMILRLAETFGVSVLALDGPALFAEPKTRATIEDFSCGALARRGRQDVTLADVTEANLCGRLIATTVDQSASQLPAFAFLPGDVVMIGNEYDGLPGAIECRASARLHVPMTGVFTPKFQSHAPIDETRQTGVPNDGAPSLNAAMCAAIICYSAFVRSA